MNLKIFTFWEPKENVPGYIQLCMKTWKKHMSGYKVALCDYETLLHYLEPEEIEQILSKKMSLPKQSDAIRCALLRKHGGIWLDADTIITPAFPNLDYSKSQCCMFGDIERHILYGAFIYAAQSNTLFMNEWHNKLVPRIREYKKAVSHLFFYKIFCRSRWRILRRWDFCINAIIDELHQKMNNEEFCVIDREEALCIPELDKQNFDSSADEGNAYRRFWFTNGNDEQKWETLKKNKGVIMLHNSWTPEKYKKMPAEEFLNSDCFLAKYLRYLLAD